MYIPIYPVPNIFRLFRLAEADKEVQEAYKKIALARSKKKSPSKKEKDVAWKALKDREAILKQLESVWIRRLIYFVNIEI